MASACSLPSLTNRNHGKTHLLYRPAWMGPSCPEDMVANAQTTSTTPAVEQAVEQVVEQEAQLPSLRSLEGAWKLVTANTFDSIHMVPTAGTIMIISSAVDDPKFPKGHISMWKRSETSRKLIPLVKYKIVSRDRRFSAVQTGNYGELSERCDTKCHEWQEFTDIFNFLPAGRGYLDIDRCQQIKCMGPVTRQFAAAIVPDELLPKAVADLSRVSRLLTSAIWHRTREQIVFDTTLCLLPPTTTGESQRLLEERVKTMQPKPYAKYLH